MSSTSEQQVSQHLIQLVVPQIAAFLRDYAADSNPAGYNALMSLNALQLEEAKQKIKSALDAALKEESKLPQIHSKEPSLTSTSNEDQANASKP